MFGLEGFYCDGIINIDVLERFQGGKFVVVLQDVFCPQVFTKQLHKRFFLFFTVNGGWIRETLFQFCHHIHKATLRFTCYDILKTFHVLFVALFQYHVFGVLITKQSDGVNGDLFEITEGHDIAKGFGGIIDTVSARKCLHQSVIAQVFINKQGVQGRGVR